MRLDLRGTGRHRGVTGFAVGVIATMTIAGGGVALASIPSSSTAKFTGCVAKQGGALRVIDAQAGKKCKSSEKKITWSKGWTHRGGWASGTTYKPGDVVTQSGSSYVAKSKSTGVSPASNASTWGLLAAAGATGATGTTGAKGDKGDKGDQGDPGTAVAYAVVTSTGTVELAKSKNITDANIQKGSSAGNYCIRDLSFTPRNVMVAAQAAFDGGQADVIATGFLAEGSVSTAGCSGKALVRTFDISDAALADRAFMIWFED